MMQTQSLAVSDQGKRPGKRELARTGRSPSQRGHARLAKSFGWLGIAIGVLEIAAPSLLARLIGVPDDRRARWGLFACGLREIVVGAGILGSARSKAWMWSRVAGNVLDLGLLGAAVTSRKSNKNRIANACAGIAAMTLIHAAVVRRLEKTAPTSDAGADRDRIEHTRAVTILASRQRIEGCWQSVRDEEPTKHSEPIFTTAPGGRGIEVRVLTNKLRARAVEAKLRRLKQLVEAGEIIQSDASIHRGRHPAKPSKRGRVESDRRELLR